MSQTSGPPSSIRPGGLVAGKYRIDSLLGEGGMGTVWAATHVDLGQRVALKLISSELARSADLLARFRAEAKAAAQLSSRYVVRMYDSGVTEDGRPYIAMEYLNGESLEDRLSRVGSLPLAVTVRIVSQVCKALKLAHAQGIIHRDLKPANIFLAVTGDDEEVAKVLDFGIAKMLDHERDHGATATGIILGTPLYMSPEQARALKTLDHRSDLYSLGMVTYRMLVGDPPFQGESFGDLVFSICTKPLPSMNEQVPSLPPSLDVWFQTACAKDPDARFATAEQMNDTLWAASGLSSSQFVQIDTGGHALPQHAASVPLTAPSAGVAPSMIDSGARGALAGGHSRGTVPTITGTANTTSGTALPAAKQRGGAVWPLALGAGVLVLGGLAGGALWLQSGATAEAEEPVLGAAVLGAAVADTTETEQASPPTDTEPPRSANGDALGPEGPSSAASAPNAEPTSTSVPSVSIAASATDATLGDAPPEKPQAATRVPRRPTRGGSEPPTKPPPENPSPGQGKSGTPDMGF